MSTNNRNIELPLWDKRHYKYCCLSNDLQAILVSDPECDRAACAVTVGVGSLLEGDIDGLAHFCEHMLFLGTEKYPIESEYEKYLQLHGGFFNAYTGEEQTCYYFSVSPDALEGSIERFAQFFISPLFTPSGTDREIDAVDSEHTNNILLDGARIEYLFRRMANPEHTIYHFTTGNAETLRNQPKAKGIDLREKLLEFYQKWYSSNIMSLCIIGKESIEDLEKMIKNNRFDQIINKKVSIKELNQFGGPNNVVAYRKEDLRHLMRFVPAKDTRSLVLSWILPEQKQYWKEKPTSYISGLIGYEGPGSLLSLLKQKGYAISLGATNPGLATAGGFSKFDCHIELTELGTQHIPEVTKMVHDYIKLLRKNPIQEWYFDEIKDIMDINFKYAAPSSPTTDVVYMSSNLQLYPPEYIQSGPSRIFASHYILIEEMLKCLTESNLMVMLANPKYKETAEREKWEMDPFYQVLYKKEPLNTSTLENWTIPEPQEVQSQNASKELAFPKPNKFIPKDLQVKEPPAVIHKYPTKLIVPKNLPIHIYFKQDTTFKLPKILATFRFCIPYARESVENLTKLQLHIMSIKQHINEFYYDAEMAGLEYALDTTANRLPTVEPGDGFNIQLAGYHDRLFVLFKEILKHIKSASFTEEDFGIAKSLLVKQLQNAVNLRKPYDEASSLPLQLCLNPYFKEEDRLKIAKSLEYDEVKAATSNILKNIIVEGALFGNINKDDAHSKYIQLIEEEFKDYLYSKDKANTNDFKPTKVLDLLTEQTQVQRISINKNATHPNQLNNASCLSICFPKSNPQQAALLTLLVKYVAHPFFENLRTKQQLGYIVSAGASRLLNIDRIVFTIQSSRYPPEELINRTEAFLEYYLDEVEEHLTQEEFDSLRESEIKQLLEKPDNLGDEFSRYRLEVNLRRYEFDRREKQIEFLKTLKKEDFIFFIKTRVLQTPWIASKFKAAKIDPANINNANQDTDVEHIIPLKPKKKIEWREIDSPYTELMDSGHYTLNNYILPGWNYEILSYY